eukprot:maker-scaffold_7-snap-gene-11.53-mRNA-1 protein AED:0.05 eAED:0.05 QI:48/0.5/0.33/1/0/0/3/0/234
MSSNAAKIRPRNTTVAGSLTNYHYTLSRLKLEIEQSLANANSFKSITTGTKREGQANISVEEVELKLQLYNDILVKVNDMVHNIHESNLAFDKQALWKQRLRNYSLTYRQLRRRMLSISKQIQRKEEENLSRKELFGYYDKEQARLANVFNNFQEENESLKRSDKLLTESLEVAKETLSTLKTQGQSLFSSTTVLSDTLGRMNVVSSLVKLIDRKEAGNKLIILMFFGFHSFSI